MSRLRAYLNNFFWLFLTYFFAPYLYFRIFLRKRRKKGELKILVIQGAKIGDLVCTTPVFREIKKKFPSCYLTALVTSKTKDILKNNPRLDKIMSIGDFPGITGKIRLIRKLRKEKYDWVFNVLPDSFNSLIPFWSLAPGRVTTTHKYFGEIVGFLSIFNNHRLEYKRHTSQIKHILNLLKFIGITENSEKKEIFIQPIEEEKALNFLNRSNLNSNDLLVGIAVTAGLKLKEWRPSYFAGLADLLVEKLKARIIFIGSAEDKKTIEKVQGGMMRNESCDASGYFKLNELPALLRKLKLFISVDAGPLHIADAMGIPLVVIAGPIDIRAQHPTHSPCKIIQKKMPCVPCVFAFSAPRFCKEGHWRCLKNVTPEEVFDAAASLC